MESSGSGRARTFKQISPRHFSKVLAYLLAYASKFLELSAGFEPATGILSTAELQSATFDRSVTRQHNIHRVRIELTDSRASEARRFAKFAYL